MQTETDNADFTVSLSAKAKNQLKRLAWLKGCSQKDIAEKAIRALWEREVYPNAAKHNATLLLNGIGRGMYRVG